MDYFAGLDVSVRDTSVCIVDDTGGIIQEVKVASEPDALLVFDEPYLPLQVDRPRSWTAVAMAVQRAGGSWFTGDLCRDAAHAGGAKSADQQDGSQ